MKALLLFSLLLVFGCRSLQSGSSASRQGQESTIDEIDGRWLMISLKGQSVDQLSYNIPPTLEINSSEMRLGGSDGCNNFFGELGQLDKKRIEFGLIGSTKAYCPEIRDEDLLGRHLNSIKSYKIAKNQLFLFNESGIEVLRYSRSK